MTTQQYPEIGPVSEEWMKAMLRATDEDVRTFKLTDGSYVAPSKSKASLYHHIPVYPNGKIGPCADCESRVVCKHRGAVAKRELIARFGEYAVRKMLAEAAAALATPAPASDAGIVESAPTRRGQIYRAEAS